METASSVPRFSSPVALKKVGYLKPGEFLVIRRSNLYTLSKFNNVCWIIGFGCLAYLTMGNIYESLRAAGYLALFFLVIAKVTKVAEDKRVNLYNKRVEESNKQQINVYNDLIKQRYKIETKLNICELDIKEKNETIAEQRNNIKNLEGEAAGFRAYKKAYDELFSISQGLIKTLINIERLRKEKAATDTEYYEKLYHHNKHMENARLKELTLPPTQATRFSIPRLSPASICQQNIANESGQEIQRSQKLSSQNSSTKNSLEVKPLKSGQSSQGIPDDLLES